MMLAELNKIIDEKYGDMGVHVHPSVWPEVEKLYLSPEADKITKEQIADFYQKYDYQGVRNALDVTEHLDDIQRKMIYGDGDVILTPSQVEWLKMLGWQMDKLKQFWSKNGE